MSLNIVYPEAAEMHEIQQDLVTKSTKDDIAFKYFPIVSKPTFNVRWVQQDNDYGLMQFRGLGGAPARVQRTGTAIYSYEPGVYGDYTYIDEKEYLIRSDPKDPFRKIDVSDLVMIDQRLLTVRRLNRMRYNIYTLCTAGTITINAPGPNGPSIYTDSYGIQTYTPLIPWSLTATATPLANGQAVQQLEIGHSGAFGAEADWVMNRPTANRLLNNSNAADFGGRRDQYGATINDIVGFNSYFQGQGLPKIVVVDAGYQTQLVAGPITNVNQQYQKYLSNGQSFIIGKRPGNASVGQYQQVINAQMPERGPGPYTFVKDYFNGIYAPKEVPGKLEVHHGMNGGLTLDYPTAIVSVPVG